MKNTLLTLKVVLLKNLRTLHRSIDHKKYPEHYKLVLNRLDATVTKPELVDLAPEPKIVSNWFESPDVLRDRRIPWSYIFFSLSILTLYWLLGTFLGLLDTIKYRPWISWLISVIIFIVCVFSLLVYGIKSCKKLGYWPLFTIRSPKNVVLEFFRSLLILIPIRIAIGLVILTIGAIIDVEMTKTSFIRFATYGPNSWVVVCWLIFTFTVGPAIGAFFTMH